MSTDRQIMKDRKDKLVQFGFYLLYIMCTVGVFFGIVYNQSTMIAMSMLTAIIGVVAEVSYFKEESWPIIGSDEYNKLVDKIRHAIAYGRDFGESLRRRRNKK